MTGWDDGDPGDIDTLADEAYAYADQERKRLRELRKIANRVILEHGETLRKLGEDEANERAATAENDHAEGEA